MDGDPTVESTLDSFSLTLPLPYRIALVIVLGVWAWGVNLQYLSIAKIDVVGLIKYPHRASPRTDPPHHLSTYRLALLLTVPLAFSLFLFWALSHRNPELVIFYDFLPIAYLCYLAIVFLLPWRRFSHAGRARFLQILRRVSIGGIALPKDGKFGDILLADVLTSYAKIIADLFVAICMFFETNGSATNHPNRACGGQYVVPLIIALPYAIRFRQCVIEYMRVRATNQKSGGTSGHDGWGGQHLANALKYATAFPVIIFSVLQRHFSADPANNGTVDVFMYRCWLVAVFINSGYSFYWDVTKDWDLTLFSTARRSHLHFYGLRPRLYFRAKEVYYLAIIIDLILRFTWALKLSPHLDHYSELEAGLFLLEFMEIARRWIWIFFRVETEWGRNAIDLGADGQSDILLGNYDSGSLLGDDFDDDEEDDE